MERWPEDPRSAGGMLSAVPLGLENIYIGTYPPLKRAGYFRMSLRDEGAACSAGFSLWASTSQHEGLTGRLKPVLRTERSPSSRLRKAWWRATFWTARAMKTP